MNTVRLGPARRGVWRGLLLPAAVTFVGLAVLIGLGSWQVERKAWKEGLLRAIAERAHEAPGTIAPEAAWPTWEAATDEFRRVRLSGTFLHDREIALHGLAEERRGDALQGFYVFTPLRMADGATVMVNRGFVPTDLRDPARRAGGQTIGPVEVTGLVRAPERRGAFVPENDPGKAEWFVRDLGQMIEAGRLERAAPFYVDADGTSNPGGWPRGGQTQLTLPNNHLGYAITWFGLAGALAAVFALYASKRVRSGGEILTEDREGVSGDAALVRTTG